MGGRIRQLPDGVIDQIAAGEVVERPSSILKELLENAADASASRIEAQVFGAFPFSLRVSDDGVGMTAEEAEVAVRRHTTSKIATVDDLQKLLTYGFRGEALPSIASVSRLRILTRPRDQNLGTEVVVEGGKVRSVREVGAPHGTTVEVSELFTNVPARLKFLKTPRTEMGHLWEVFHGVGIPREGISFRLHDGRTDALYEKGESRLDRAKRHAGEGAKYLAPLSLSSAFFRISGWGGSVPGDPPPRPAAGDLPVHRVRPVRGGRERSPRQDGSPLPVREGPVRAGAARDRGGPGGDSGGIGRRLHPRGRRGTGGGAAAAEGDRFPRGGPVRTVPDGAPPSPRLRRRLSAPGEGGRVRVASARRPAHGNVHRLRGGRGGGDRRPACGGRADRLLPAEGFLPRKERARPEVAGPAGRLPPRSGEEGARRDRGVPDGGRVPLRVVRRKYVQDLGM